MFFASTDPFQVFFDSLSFSALQFYIRQNTAFLTKNYKQKQIDLDQAFFGTIFRLWMLVDLPEI